METETPESSPSINCDSTVDASRPFRSVKEAVAIFGDRLLTPPRFSIENKEQLLTPSRFSLEIKETASDLSAIPDTPTKQPLPSPVYSPAKHIPLFSQDKEITSDSSVFIQSPNKSLNEPTQSRRNPADENHNKIVHGNDLVMMLMVLKKLESELQETKMEVKKLKEKESETEVALASLNAELLKNKREPVESVEGEKREMGKRDEGEKATATMMVVKNMDSPTLAQILSISDYEGYFRETKNVSKSKVIKKKPIVPLVTDIFPWKKRSSPSNGPSGPLFSSHMYLS